MECNKEMPRSDMLEPLPDTGEYDYVPPYMKDGEYKIQVRAGKRPLFVSVRELREVHYIKRYSLNTIARWFKISPTRLREVMFTHGISPLKREFTKPDCQSMIYKTKGADYKKISLPDENGAKRPIAYHRFVMAHSLDRELSPNEAVHHIDLDKENNDLSNLLLCKDNKEHARVHATINASASILIKMGIIKYADGGYFVDFNMLPDGLVYNNNK